MSKGRRPVAAGPDVNVDPSGIEVAEVEDKDIGAVDETSIPELVQAATKRTDTSSHTGTADIQRPGTVTGLGTTSIHIQTTKGRRWFTRYLSQPTHIDQSVSGACLGPSENGTSDADGEPSLKTDRPIVGLDSLVMVRVAIDARQLDSLPDLCVKTGEPTGSIRRQDFADIPGWTLLLIFWGVIPFLIAAAFARRRIGVDLPASEETLRRIRLVDSGAVAGLVLAIGLLVVGWVSQGAVFAWAGIAVALITLVAAAVARGMSWVSGRLDDEILWLYGVHPAFADQAQGWHLATSPSAYPPTGGGLDSWWPP